MSRGRDPQSAVSSDPWKNLAAAVVLQACSDLRSSLKARNEGKEIPWDIAELERFFRSKWFGVLTKLDGEEILQRIEEEYGENDS